MDVSTVTLLLLIQLPEFLILQLTHKVYFVLPERRGIFYKTMRSFKQAAVAANSFHGPASKFWSFALRLFREEIIII